MSRDIENINLQLMMQNLYQSGKYYASIGGRANAEFEEDYWELIKDPDGAVRNRLLERDSFISDISLELDFIKSLKPGKVLDVGCGLGWLLSALDDKWLKYGLEVSNFASKYAEKYAEIKTGELLNCSYDDNTFDLVVMHHVIEHMQEPELNINYIKRILKSNGHLIIATPDFDSGCARRFGSKYRLLSDDTHISLFSNDSMHRFLRDFGFKILRVEYPFFDTKHFSRNNLDKMFDLTTTSPPFYGNFMTFICINGK
jgi:SAM-dependent methyltransferase